MPTPSLPADARPLDEPLREQFVEPFVAAIRLALAEMATVAVAVRAVYQTRGTPAPRDFAAVVELRSTTPRLLVLAFPARTARDLTGRILRDVKEADHERLIGDCVGEIANVVAGHAKTALSGTRYQFSCALPKVVAGPLNLPARGHGGSELVAILDCDAGEIDLRIIPG